MNAHVRFNLSRFAFGASGASNELWTGSVRLAGSEPQDEFRLVKWHLLARARANPPPAPRNAQVILVTSARPNEGKTYVARNLVASLALDGHSEVTLIDANFNNPGLPSASLMGSYHKGLLDVLAGDHVDVKSTFLDSNRPNVHLLPGGKPRSNVSEMLNSDRMHNLLRQLTSGGAEHLVVIDAGGVLANSEAAILAQYCGHILFVAAESQTRKPDVESSLQLLDQLAWPIDGDGFSFILNKLPA